MLQISSPQNPIIKEIKSLKEKKFREEKGLFFIEGIRFVEEALKEKAEFHCICVSEKLQSGEAGANLLDKLKGMNCKQYLLTEKIFKELTDTENPQGILAVLPMKKYTLDEVLGQDNFLMILDSIQDPGNMGTIIRTADAAGITGVILSKGCVDIYNPKVLRSTMGAIFHVPAVFSSDLPDTLLHLKSRGIKLFAAHLEGLRNCFEENMRGNIAIMIGNEANGISDEAAILADGLVRIPMPGRAESLNASVAAGVLIYEALRQRMNK